MLLWLSIFHIMETRSGLVQELHSFCFVWFISLSPSVTFPMTVIQPEMIDQWGVNFYTSWVNSPSECIFLWRKRHSTSLLKDGGRLKVIRGQSWSHSMCKSESWDFVTGRPQEAVEAALWREMGNRAKAQRNRGHEERREEPQFFFPSSEPHEVVFWPWMPVIACYLFY
jgi:hypothetical protein